MTTVKDWGKEIIQIDMTNEELSAAVNLLDFTVAAFEVLAKSAQDNEDDDAFRNLQIRMAFAKVFAKKLQNNLELGNAKNETFH